MNNTLNGSCLCGAITYKVKHNFKRFYQCHCKQCQQITGSAFAANIFTSPDNIEWLSGQGQIHTYNHPTRSFTKAFCKQCGCGMPFVTQNGKALLIPAGTLTDDIDISPEANIFTNEQVTWLDDGHSAISFEGFPKQN